jgi:hypothetical protein
MFPDFGHSKNSIGITFPCGPPKQSLIEWDFGQGSWVKVLNIGNKKERHTGTMGAN